MESRFPKVEMANQAGQQPLQVLNTSSQQTMPSQKDEDKMPLFLIKLWNIVEDPAYQNIIRWDESGYSFHIIDPYAFCRNVLPHYFKHNNLNSLIRQLNMYGFRKVSPLDKGGLTRSESDQDHLEFSHTSFIRGRPDLMVNIKRRQSNRGADNNVVSAQTQGNLSVVMDELRQLREKQRNMDSKMHEITKENEALWGQLDHVRQQHNRQQQVVNKLVQFLVAIVQPNMSKRVLKRGVLAIDEPPNKRPRSSNSQNSNNNIVDMLDRLQREIVEGGGLQQQKGYQNDRGPIIADVTDELYSNSPPYRNNEPHVASPGSSNIPGAYNNDSTQLNHPYEKKQTLSNSVPYQQTEVAPNKMMFNQPAPDNQIVSNPNYTPTFTMSPGFDRQISQELQEYLHGMDNGIDNCRDLLSGNWDFDLFENLDEDSNHATSTSLPNHQLALEQAPAMQSLDFLGNAPDAAQHDMIGQQLDIPFSVHNPNPTCSTPTLLTPCTSPTYQ